MRIDAATIKSIVHGAQFYGVPEHTKFGLINISHIKEFESQDRSDTELYCVVYEDDPDQEGWYDLKFDRSKNIQRLSTRKDLVFLVDSRVNDLDVRGIRYIRVPNIFNAVEEILNYVLSTIQPRIVGVTGSVGKTTSVAFIQSVLERRFGCGRIYAKRLTPLTLSSWIANYLEPKHQMLVLEYAMYRKHHVGELAKMLKPYVGVMLNIKRMHLGVHGINTLEDIRDGKRALIEQSEVALLNADDDMVMTLARKGDFTFSLSNKKADAYLEREGAEAVLKLNNSNQTLRFLPYVRTQLFYYQSLAAGLVGSLLDIPPEEISVALTQFRPESRIRWVTIAGKQMLFEGDVTHSGRMSALTDHNYDSSVLLVYRMDFADENVDLQVDDLSRVFSRLDEVRILDTEENRDVMSTYGFANCTLVTKENFLKNIDAYKLKILHWGAYFRRHEGLEDLFASINSA